MNGGDGATKAESPEGAVGGKGRTELSPTSAQGKSESSATPTDQPSSTDEGTDCAVKKIGIGEKPQLDLNCDQVEGKESRDTHSPVGTDSRKGDGESNPSDPADSTEDLEQEGHIESSEDGTITEPNPARLSLKDEERISKKLSDIDENKESAEEQVPEGKIQVPEIKIQYCLESDSSIKEDTGKDDSPAEESTNQASALIDAPTQFSSADVPIKVRSAHQNTRDLSDQQLDAMERPESNLSSIKSSNPSAKLVPTAKVTLPEQHVDHQMLPSPLLSSKKSNPSSESREEDGSHLSKVEDKVNNNILSCNVSCQESSEQSSVAVSAEYAIIKEQASSGFQASTPVGEAVGDTSNTQDRSMLMQYLGLQPVQEGGKSSSRGHSEKSDVVSMKPRFGFTFLDSFSTMPGLELMNPYEKIHVSQNTSPFEVYSEGSHSPEPPVLAETPVVGSSPPRHDYDAMEARMMDMTPRSNSMTSRRDLLSSFPPSDPTGQDVKTVMYKKRHLTLGHAPSESLDSLCYRLVERVESNSSVQDDEVLPGLGTAKSSFVDIEETDSETSDVIESKKFADSTGIVPCPRCHRTFSNRNQLRGHLRWHINDPINLLSRRWSTNRTSPKLQTSSSEEQVLHTITSNSTTHNVEKIVHRKKQSPPQTRVNVHQQKTISLNAGGIQDSFTCTLCGKMFRTSLKLRGHMMVHKRKPPRRKGPYWTKKTNKTSGSSEKVARHQCEVCSNIFDSQMKLHGHMTSHAHEVHPRSKGVKRLGSHVNNPSANDNCSSLSSSSDAVSSIKQKILLGRKKNSFKCDVCFKTFPTLRARNGHKGIHSSKWKLASALHHLGRPVKVKKTTESSSTLGPHCEDQLPNVSTPGETCQTKTMNRNGNEEQPGGDESKAEEPRKSLNYKRPCTLFKCSHCHLVFASRHRVRKHLSKVHSVSAPGIDSFTEEKVDGCKFCEVFKKRKRGRPKRGENTLIKCVHGKIVVGYNLPLGSLRLSKQIRHTTKTNKSPKIQKETSVDRTFSPEDMQLKCMMTLSPLDMKPTEQNVTTQDQARDTESKPMNIPLVKRRGRPPKNHANPLFAVQNSKQTLFSLTSARSKYDGTRKAASSYRKQRRGKQLTLLGRQLKSGWDPKKQRFIGRPYKCHLCKMSYRSERQLCSHMRSHGIHIFDLSHLPADQRGNHLLSNGEMETNDAEGVEVGVDEAALGHTGADSIANPNEGTESYSQIKVSDSGVGGTCAVCRKEFDSDNMFHQHLLGRFNKKCRQEWMKQKFGVGMRSKMSSSPGQVIDDNTPRNPAEDQSNGNIYVIDKISMESFQGSGVFSNLQQKVSDKTETVLQGDKSGNDCEKRSSPEDIKDVVQSPLLSTSTNEDPEPTNIASPKKGAVLDAVISRLTQSSKTTGVINSSTPVSIHPSNPTKTHRGSAKLVFKCSYCGKAFDKKQKLSVHAIIHKPKVATVMDHVENANQRSTSSVCKLSNGDEREKSILDQLPSTEGIVNISDSVPSLQLTYSCSECPKQFTSNLKLASHLKMHMKSTKSRSVNPGSNQSNELLGENPEHIVDDREKESAAQANDVSEVHADIMNADTIGNSPVRTEEEVTVKNSTTANGDVGKYIESSEKSNMVFEDQDSVRESVTTCNVNEVSELENKETKQNSTSRPRLLLKINPVTMQRLHDCPECQKSFKSLGELAIHQRLHVMPELCPEQQDAMDLGLPHDSTKTSVGPVDNCPTDQTKCVSRTVAAVEGPGSHLTGNSQNGSPNAPTADTHLRPETIATLAKQKDASLRAGVLYTELTVACKICDKVMKKSQLGGHMKSHTKGLLARKFAIAGQDSTRRTRLIGQHAKNNSYGESTFSPNASLVNTLGLNTSHKPPSLETGNGMSSILNGEGSVDPDFSARLGDVDGPENLQNGELPNDIQGKQFTCHICNTHYDYYQQLCQHMKIHVVKYPSFDGSSPVNVSNDAHATGNIIEQQSPYADRPSHTFTRPKVYPCELCGFSFSSFRQFRVHISQTHGGKFQYRLMIQQKEAAEAGAFLQEPETINKTHPHKCDFCGRRFKRLALLIFHLNKLHKGWKQRLCMMNVRSRPRPSQTAVQSVPGAGGPPGTDVGDLPFTCELCGKSFRMKVQLCGHMKTHGRVGHSPIKISPLKMKGKYTLRKRGKPDFRLSDDWILDMDDKTMAAENSLGLQRLPAHSNLMDQPNSMKGTQDAVLYASMYTAAKPLPSNQSGRKKMVPGLAGPNERYMIPVSESNLSVKNQAVDLKIPVAPPPPEPSKFITIQMEPVLQQMLHRCLLCHSYFSSQQSAVQHCKEVHFKKKQRNSLGEVSQGTAHPLGRNFPLTGVASGMRPPTSQLSPGVRPSGPQVSPSQRPPTPPFSSTTQPPVPYLMSGPRPTCQLVPGVRSPSFDKVTSPSSRFQLNQQPTSHQFAGVLPKANVRGAPTSSPTAKTISQTPFNEMLYRVEMSEEQTRYVCNTCKSTFLHYNFLMSHLADHNHLAYTCLQCGYATYSEKDYQLHCQLHDGQISKKVRKVKPKPPGYDSTLLPELPGAHRAVATCHICQRVFVNLKGLKAHMVFHSASISSISEKRNESKRLPETKMVGPMPSSIDVPLEPIALVKPVEEQTEALDLTVKPVVESSVDEVLDLSIGSRSFPQRTESPVQDTPLNMTERTIPEENQVASLPDVCQVLQNVDPPKQPTPSPLPAEKQAHTRKPKNSIRLVGAIDVDVASLENKYSVVTDLMDTDSDISPDLPSAQGQESIAGSGAGDSEHDGKSPKKLRNYKCSMCQYATDFKDSMDRHEQKHRRFRTLACHQCSYRTPEKRLMLRHVLTIHEKQKPYQCKLCSYSSAYKHHLKRHHTKRHQRPLLTCTQCEFTTEDVTKLENHTASHPEPKVYKCKLCPMVFNSSKLFKAHKQIVHNKKKKSKKGSRDRSHSSSGVGDSSESAEGKQKESLPFVESQELVVLKHPCKLCKYQTDDHNELTKHLMKKHFSSPTKEGGGDVCTTAQCPQCGYLTGKDQLKAHMQIHDSGEFFNCDQCLFKACTQEELDNHVHQKHKVKATAKMTCKMCGMHFWDAEDIKQHTEMHLKDSSISIKNPFYCNMCPLKLMNRRDALRHLQLHTDRYPFKCCHCVFSCFTKASIQRHLSIHRHTGKPKTMLAVRKNSRKSLSASSSPSSDTAIPTDTQKNWRKSHSTTC